MARASSEARKSTAAATSSGWQARNMGSTSISPQRFDEILRFNVGSAYGAAKATQTQLTRLLAQDFAPRVRVNGIAPGPILTAALDRALPAAMREGMVRNTPLQRLGETEDIAAATLYLATPASGWVTGKIIEVNDGAESSVWPG